MKNNETTAVAIHRVTKVLVERTDFDSLMPGARFSTTELRVFCNGDGEDQGACLELTLFHAYGQMPFETVLASEAKTEQAA